jgi:RNA polymerase sigma factor (sigma-70 family)
MSAEDEDFANLIRRVRAGEEQAAAELVRRYEPAIRRVVRVHLHDPRLRMFFDSFDVCQSVLASFFVRVHLGQFELDSPDKLLHLLVTIARHKVTNQALHHQSQRRDYRRRQTLHDVASGALDPGKEVEIKDLLEQVRSRLSAEEGLLAEQRSRGESWADIAAIQGGSADALRKKFSRALDRVLAELGLAEVEND